MIGEERYEGGGVRDRSAAQRGCISFYWIFIIKNDNGDRTDDIFFLINDCSSCSLSKIKGPILQRERVNTGHWTGASTLGVPGGRGWVTLSVQ